ncbi:MAG: hypothetical protein AUI90_08805 [Deltaproteobacteria bacterium 13_1_40CM_3_69_14]|nr:MAG: hypothetical protein AUI90_08805 [Deltaproteobacteria bacterium 13_1_40CM_3_69_14]
MRRLAGFLTISMLFASSVARAEVTSVSARAQLSLSITPEERVCSGVFAPQPWRDASDPLFFVTSPTARMDETELSSGVLVPLASIHYVAGTLRIAGPIHPLGVATPLALLLGVSAPEERVCAYVFGL